MSDDLDRLQAALRANAPQPPPGARERASAAGLAAFDDRRQGIGDRQRQTGSVAIDTTSPLRRLAMLLSRPYPALAGVAAILVVAAIVSYQTLVIREPADPAVPPPPAPSAEPVTVAEGVDQASEPKAVEEPIEVAGLDPEAVEVLAEQAPEPLAVASQEAGIEKAAPDSLARSVQVEASVEAFADVAVAEYAEAPSAARSLATSVELEAVDAPSVGYREQGRDRFEAFDPNPVKVAAEEPVSTFSIDVDTASYAFMRASLNQGVLPQPDAVRVEELINYFPYGYAPPAGPETPFAVHVSLIRTPWNDATRLLHIGIKGYELAPAARPPANLVFLVDTSGSMDSPDKLPLLVNAFRMLLDALAPADTVAIVSYAGAAGTVLEPTPVAERGAIAAALETLRAGGSTAGAEGIRQAYLLAERHFLEGGVNRVILATDGDFNVGFTDPDELEGYIARKRESGLFLSVLGFGMGNYNDALMQRLAQNGNGNAAYIDTLTEARKVLVEEATSTLFPIAKDVKIQVEFNPALVSEYRLIGYETRMLAREDFRNDKVDAGEIGAGHTVTALYEVTPAGSGAERIAPLRYGEQETAPSAGRDDEFATVAIRYKLPDAETSTEIARHVTGDDAVASAAAAPEDVRFAAAVAAFGQLLRGGRYTEDYGYDDVIAAARAARGEDPFGYRAEFLSLVRLAKTAAVMEPLRR
ncbi:MAG: VWA domain-containing protein [Rhodospirillales bacterium]|nr:VWA domain-containing protein [Rhodospirillales bacterium]